MQERRSVHHVGTWKINNANVPTTRDAVNMTDAAAKWRKVEVQSIRLLLVHANAGAYDKSFDALEQEWRLAPQHGA
jgi:hypothetical protein